MELVLDSSGCVLIHEVLILINCLLMMVKWSDLVSGSCAGVARRPGPLRARAVTRRALGRSCRRGAVSLVLCSCRILAHVSMHHHAGLGTVWAERVMEGSLGETRERIYQGTQLFLSQASMLICILFSSVQASNR